VNTDVLNYDLELEVNPVSQWIGGSNTITVQSVIDGLDAFQFRLRSVYTISALEVNGVPATWTRLNDDTVEVELTPFQDAGDVFDVFIAYAGYPQSQGSWGSIVFGVRGTNEVPVVWTLSQPWWAHTWWPVKEDNRDKATADLTFTVPANLTVASTACCKASPTSAWIRRATTGARTRPQRHTCSRSPPPTSPPSAPPGNATGRVCRSSSTSTRNTTFRRTATSGCSRPA